MTNMTTTELGRSKGFIKAAMANGMTPLQALAFYKLAEGGMDPQSLQQLHSSPMMQDYVHSNWMSDGMEKLKGTPFDHLLGASDDAFKTVGLGAGGLGLMYLLGANAKKREREQKAQYPTKVTYAG